MVRHKRPKYKGKTGRIDFIEDYLGTEALKGTYEIRKNTQRMYDQEKAFVDKYNADKINTLRKAKMEELVNKVTDQKKIEEMNWKMTFTLYNVLMPDAYKFLDKLRENDFEICDKIVRYIIPNDDMARLDAYVDRIRSHGPPKTRINLATIIKYYRHFKGIKGKITIKEKGEDKYDL